MEKSYTIPDTKNITWTEAWANNVFRRKAIGATVTMIAILILLPFFYTVIEQRDGIVLHDWFLQALPAYDFSVPIFIIIWSTVILMVVRCVKSPAIYLSLICSAVLLTVLRLFTIYFVALDPPADLIVLKDPLTSIMYGGTDVFITKDLFFSGHTSNILLIGLCLEKKFDKLLVYIAAVTVGFLVLVQHVHYSVDVIGAIIITLVMVKIGKRLASF